jgi:hypothetical protein
MVYPALYNQGPREVVPHATADPLHRHASQVSAYILHIAAEQVASFHALFRWSLDGEGRPPYLQTVPVMIVYL